MITPRTEYRRDFTAWTGISYIGEDEREVHLTSSRPVPPRLRRSLAAYHGKAVVIHPSTGASVPTVDPVPSGMMPANPGRAGQLTDPSDDQPSPADPFRLRNLSEEDRLIRALLTAAVDQRATDWTLWPAGPASWTVTIRIAGSLRSLGHLPEPVALRVVRRVMVRAELDPFDMTAPQDGVLTVPWFPCHRFRVAVLGTGHGPIVAIRILSRQVPVPPALGYDPVICGRVLQALASDSGLVLFVGRTGSGKTTGIASFVSLVAGWGRKVVTIEDPVEYRIPGAVQIERAIHGQGDLIAAAMRQDPDIILLSEIRTRDHVLQISRAMASGHLIVSSIHAADADGARLRLHHLGMTDRATRALTRLLIVQHLVPPRQLHVRVFEEPWRGAV